LEVLYNPINFGFAGGVNTGIEWALNEDFEYVALFNNDAIADKNWLQSLVEAARPKEVGITTGLLLHENGKTIDSSGDWLSSWGLAFPRNRGDNTAKAFKAGPVFGATGGASLYKTALFKDIGLFGRGFFCLLRRRRHQFPGPAWRAGKSLIPPRLSPTTNKAPPAKKSLALPPIIRSRTCRYCF